MILHIVLYQPKASATAKDLTELVEVLQTAAREIPSVLQVRVGRTEDLGFGYQNWPKDRNTGNVAVFEFADRSGLERYLAHPAHRRLADLFWKTSDEPLVFDVVSIDPVTESV